MGRQGKTENTILLLGDSLIEYGDWRRLLPEWRVRNQGRAGETVQGLRQRLPVVLRQLPGAGAVVVMSGTNNLAMDDFSFLVDYEAIVSQLQATLPRAVVVVTELLPVRFPWLAPDAVSRINDRLAAMTGRLQVALCAVHADFLQADGRPDGRCFADDGVHLSAEGYGRWGRRLTKMLPVYRR